MRRVRFFLVPAIALGVGLLLSACGGDSSPETPIAVPTETQPGLNKAEFIAQADATCKEANAAIQQFASAGQGLTEAGQIADLRNGVVETIKQLGSPTEDQTTLDQFLKAMEDEVSAGQKISLAQQRGTDTAQFETELDSAKTAASSAASSYGFQECGQSINSSSTSTTPSAVVPGSSSSSSSSSSSGTVTPPSSSSTTGGGTSGSTGSGTSGSSGSSGSGGSGNSGGVGPGQ